MNKNYLLLILLSAIWGSSFIFMRVLAPVFGAASTASFRLLIGSLTLLFYFKKTNYKIKWQQHGFMLLIIGLLNSALPFFLYAFAALYIPASLSVMINGMTPMFGTIFAFLLLSESISLKKIMGLSLGTLGVVIMSYSKALPHNTLAYLSILACLGAASCYGLSAAIIKKYAHDIPAKSLAGGSQLIAGLALLPFVFNTKSFANVQVHHIFLLLIFGALCSGLAYLIYYHIIKTLGPSKALTVTFLMPVFGVFWGRLILFEKIYFQSLIGGSIILIGTFWVVQKNKVIK